MQPGRTGDRSGHRFAGSALSVSRTDRMPL